MTAPPKLPYSDVSLFRDLKGKHHRAMRQFYRNFAFTYRFSFTGERAGETRAVR